MSILITILIMTSITAVLALLLSLASRYIANYGQFKITVNHDKEYIVEGGNSLLTSLRESQIFIPSACGGKGSCAYCKVKIVHGGGPILSTELPYLSKEEIHQNVRLSCQCKVKEDIQIEIPDGLLYVKEYQAVVTEIVDLSPTIKMLKLDLKSPADIAFKPGQYIQLKAPLYDGNQEEVYRAYSIASNPQITNMLELIIGYVPNGICSTYVHQYLRAGNEVLLNGPYGDFYLQDSHRDIILIAVGTGMAPMRSILQEIVNRGIQRKITYFFGARALDDLILYEEMKDLEMRIPNFTFVPCLSRPRDEDHWDGQVGRVTDLIERYISNPEDMEVYLCGSKAMIDSTLACLKEKGISEEFIYYDKFD